MNTYCPKCRKEIKVLYKGLGIFCKNCGYFQQSGEYQRLVDNLEQRHNNALNELKIYFKSKMENKDVDTQE